MHTRVVLLVLLAVTSLSLVAVVDTTGAATESEYNISIDGSFDVPERTVTVEGDEYNITELKTINPGDTFTAKFDVPTASTVEFRDLDKNTYDADYIDGDDKVSFDTSKLDDNDPLKPGTYFVALQVSGTLQTIFPVIVEGYDVTATVPTTVEERSSLEVNATVTEKPENEQTLTGVNVVIENDTTSRIVNVSGSAGTISTAVPLGDLPPGNYSVYAAARGDETFSEQKVPIGLSTPGTLNVTPTSVFSVSSLSAPASAVQGDTITVDATVNNLGSVEGTTTVEFLFNGTVSRSKSVTVGAGGATHVSFALSTSGTPPGSYTYGIRAGSSFPNGSIDVVEPTPEFSVTSLSAPSSAVTGTNVTVNGTISNIGTAEGTTDVEFVFDGTVLQTESVTLAAGNSTDVSFDVSTGDTARTYTYGIRANSSVSNASLDVVEPPPEFSVSNLSAPSSAVTGTNVTVSATVANVGDGEGTTDVELVFGGAILEVQSVTLAPGNSMAVSFTVSTSGRQVGTYGYSVQAGEGSSSDSITIENAPTTTCIGDAVSGADDTISLSEIQDAINWWASGSEVPGTGGQTISLSKIQSLIDAWAEGTTVSCGSTSTTCIQDAVSGDDDKISLGEIQEAINLWAEGTEVPDTGGETISLTQIQNLINAWAEGTEVYCN